MNHSSEGLELFYGGILFIIFIAVLVDLVREWRFRRRAEKWQGAADGTVVEIKRYYRFNGYFRKRWFEYPVISYRAGPVSYRREYTIRKRSAGYYELDERMSILYNEENPEEFVFSNTFSGIFYYAGQALTAALLCISLYLSAGLLADYYLSTHELLFEEETWADLEDPLAYYEGMNFSNIHGYTFDNMAADVNEAAEHFHRIDAMIEEKRGGKNYDAYRSQYRRSAIAASQSLGDLYSGIAGTFLEECGVEGEKESVYGSAYAGFLEQICPSAVDAAGCYSMEELFFLIQLTDEAGLNRSEYREDPEESIGLSLAVFYAKLDTEMELLGYGDGVKEAVKTCFPGYMTRYMDHVDEELLVEGEKYGEKLYQKLDRAAVNSVYRFMEEQYEEKDFQTALWKSSVFAQRQIADRMEEDPSLGRLRRYESDCNPLSGFDGQAGMEAFLNYDIVDTYRSPEYYLYDWENMIWDLKTRHTGRI